MLLYLLVLVILVFLGFGGWGVLHGDMGALPIVLAGVVAMIVLYLLSRKPRGKMGE